MSLQGTMPVTVALRPAARIGRRSIATDGSVKAYVGVGAGRTEDLVMMVMCVKRRAQRTDCSHNLRRGSSKELRVRSLNFAAWLVLEAICDYHK